MTNPNHADDNERAHEPTEGVSTVSRRSALTRIGTVGALAAAGGIPFAVGSVRGQEIQMFSDDFEDGDIDGWSGIDANISTSSDAGSFSLETYDNHETGGQLVWDDGPILDTQEEFDVLGRSRADLGDRTNPIRFGLFTDFAEGVLLVHDPRHGDGVTYLADQTYNAGELPGNVDTIEDDFDDQWISFRIRFASEGLMEAKVWMAGGVEPSDFQLSFESDAVATEFAIEPGINDSNRVFNLDEIEIEGQEAESEFLELLTTDYLEYGQTADYTVAWTDEETGDREDVTDDSTVESGDTDIITVDNQAQTITATEDTDLSGRVQLLAEYPDADAPAFAPVTVAPIDMSNIDILPPWRRIQATLGDDNIATIIVAIFGGIAGSHMATSFAGLAFATVITVVAWFGGWIDTGLVMVAVFLSLFIGLNMAANIDYTVRS